MRLESPDKKGSFGFSLKVASLIVLGLTVNSSAAVAQEPQYFSAISPQTPDTWEDIKLIPAREIVPGSVEVIVPGTRLLWEADLKNPANQEIKRYVCTSGTVSLTDGGKYFKVECQPRQPH